MPIINAEQAIRKLLAGDIVAVPTETVYGLAGLISSESAIRRIFEVKERPFFDPLIVHIGDLAGTRPLVSGITPVVEEMARAFWPGPLTIVIRKSSAVSDLITAGLPSVGLRSPSHPLVRKIIENVGPFAAPSANRFTRTSPTSAEHVIAEFGDRVDVVDGGPCEVGLESTVVSVEVGRLVILRPGAIKAVELKPIAYNHGMSVESGTSRAAPGQLEKHYQPAVPLVLITRPVTENELADKLTERFGNLNPVRLVLPSETTLAARTLYSELRRLSADSKNVIIAEPARWNWSGDVSDLMDRLNRAASLIL